MVSFFVGRSEPPLSPQEESLLPTRAGLRPVQESGAAAAAAPLDSPSFQEELLIPGLPDDVARRCLLRAPLASHGVCRAVTRAWRAFFSDPATYAARRAAGLAEELLFAFSADPAVTAGEVFDPRWGRWRALPHMPSEPYTYGLTNHECVAMGASVYVLGGVIYDARTYPRESPVPSARVYRYDVATDTWSQVADMLRPRGAFAAVCMGGRIYVAGGGSRHAQFKAGGRPMRAAEVYDPADDTWRPLPALSKVRAGSCGAVVGGKFLVMGGYGSSHTVDGVLPIDEIYSNGEVFDATAGAWRELPDLWPPPRTRGGARPSQVAALGGQLYSLAAGGNAIERLVWDWGPGPGPGPGRPPWHATWQHEADLELSPDAHEDAQLVGLGGRLCVLTAGMVAPRRKRAGLQLCYDPAARRWERRAFHGSYPRGRLVRPPGDWSRRVVLDT